MSRDEIGQYAEEVAARRELTRNEIIGIGANKESTMKKEERADCETYDSGTPTERPREIGVALNRLEDAVSRMGVAIENLERRLSPVLVKAETKTDQVVPCAGTTPLGWRLSNIGNYLERIIENISDLNMRCEL